MRGGVRGGGGREVREGGSEGGEGRGKGERGSMEGRGGGGGGGTGERRREGEKGYTCTPEENTTCMWTHFSGTISLRVVVQEPIRSWSPDL